MTFLERLTKLQLVGKHLIHRSCKLQPVTLIETEDYIEFVYHSTINSLSIMGISIKPSPEKINSIEEVKSLIRDAIMQLNGLEKSLIDEQKSDSKKRGNTANRETSNWVMESLKCLKNAYLVAFSHRQPRTRQLKIIGRTWN